MCSTALVNGLVFAGAGNFTATGKQVITLPAAGEPTNAGNFDVALTMGGGICKITVTVATNTGGGTGTAEFYYKATIGGKNYYQEVTGNYGYEPGSGMGGLDEVVFGGGISYANGNLPAGKTEFGVSKGMMRNYLQATMKPVNTGARVMAR